MTEPKIHIPKSFDDTLWEYNEPLCGASRYAQDGAVMIDSPEVKPTCKNCLKMSSKKHPDLQRNS